MDSPNEIDRFLFSREMMEGALRAAALDAIRENQRYGLPMIYEREGRIVYVDPFEAEAELLKVHPELATRPPPGYRAS